MDSNTTPRGFKPATSIPERTSSKRALSTMDATELTITKFTLDEQISKRKKLLKPRSSCDSEYWSNTAELYDLQAVRNDYEAMLAFRKAASHNKDLSFEEWQGVETIGIDLSTRRAALETVRSIAAAHATSLAAEAGLTQSFLKLFFGAASGFDIGGASAGPRDKSKQSAMRSDMLGAYNEGGRTPVWEPVLGTALPPAYVSAAHLYPWRSAEHMDVIFGEGSTEELMTPSNGLFLDTNIEKMLDRGYIAIVPDIEMEPLDELNPRADMDRRRELVKTWEASSPREYKTIILDRCKGLTELMEDILGFPNLYGIKSTEEMDGRRLKFRNSFRPRARYVWWTYLNAIAQVTFRNKTQTEGGFQREVAKANRYWGTARSYVKKNVLRGFVQHIGQDLEGIRNALLEPDTAGNSDETPDTTAVSVLANETVRKTSLRLQAVGAIRESSSSEDEDGSDYETD